MKLINVFLMLLVLVMLSSCASNAGCAFKGERGTHKLDQCSAPYTLDLGE